MRYVRSTHHLGVKSRINRDGKFWVFFWVQQYFIVDIYDEQNALERLYLLDVHSLQALQTEKGCV